MVYDRMGNLERSAINEQIWPNHLPIHRSAPKSKIRPVAPKTFAKQVTNMDLCACFTDSTIGKSWEYTSLPQETMGMHKDIYGRCRTRVAKHANYFIENQKRHGKGSSYRESHCLRARRQPALSHWDKLATYTGKKSGCVAAHAGGRAIRRILQGKCSFPLQLPSRC